MMSRRRTTFATLSDGRGAWWRFARPLAVHRAQRPRDVGALLNDCLAPSPRNDWRIVFVAYEGCLGLLGLDPPGQPPALPPAAVWVVDPPEPAVRPEFDVPLAHWQAEWDVGRYRSAFDRIAAGIQAGEIYQANLTFRLHADAAAASPVRQAPPWSAQLSDDAWSLWSLSPECLLTFAAATRSLTTRPIKGTAAGGDVHALAGDPKERAEHVMIVDMARNDVGRVAVPGSVVVDRLAGALDVGYALHLESAVRGTVRDGVAIADVLAAMLPAASISGTPKHRACQLLAAVESSPRAAYTGTLGWIDPRGNAAFSVLIRTIWRDENGRYGYGTGGGLVADSRADREWAEALLKTRPLAAAPAT